MIFLRKKQSGRIKELLVQTSVGALSVVTSIFIVSPPDNYVFGIIQSYAVQIMLVDIAAGVWLVWKRQNISGASLLAASLILLGFLWPFLHTETPPVAPADFTVAQFNVLAKNTEYDQTIRAAFMSGADILAFEEVTSEWIDRLHNAFEKEYPHSVYEEDTVYKGFYGVILFSKYPVKRWNTYYWQGVPNITATLSGPHGEINVVAAHTFSPVNDARYEARNRHLKDIENYVVPLSGTTLVMGDLNIVPWAPQVKEFKDRTKLHDSRTGLSPTFPAWNSLMMVPIDYIFHSNNIETLDFRVIISTSSDHYGVVGKFQFR